MESNVVNFEETKSNTLSDDQQKYLSDFLENQKVSEETAIAQETLSNDNESEVNEDEEKDSLYKVSIDPETGEYDDDLIDELESWSYGSEYNDLLVRLYAEMAIEAAAEIIYGEDVKTIIHPFVMKNVVDDLIKSEYKVGV